MFDFDNFPFKLSGKTVAYICPKCKNKFDAPIEAVLEFEQEDEWNGLPISIVYDDFPIIQEMLLDIGNFHKSK